MMTRRQGVGHSSQVSAEHAVATAKAAGLTSSQHGDTIILAKAIRSLHPFFSSICAVIPSPPPPPPPPPHNSTFVLPVPAFRCDRHYARKVLLAISGGTEKILYRRELRKGAIKGTEWPFLLRQFVLESENSRTHPGQELVSVGRNLPKVPKRILNNSRDRIVKDFLKKYPDCDFQK